jgi:hypothetical protein
MHEYEELLLNSDDVGKSFDDKLSTIEESASLECQVIPEGSFLIGFLRLREKFALSEKLAPTEKWCLV